MAGCRQNRDDFAQRITELWFNQLLSHVASAIWEPEDSRNQSWIQQVEFQRSANGVEYLHKLRMARTDTGLCCKSMSGIDESILLDLAGRCFAIGVILAGIDAEACSSAQGSRCKTALRYVGGAPTARMAIIVSDNKTVDLAPNLSGNGRCFSLGSRLESGHGVDKKAQQIEGRTDAMPTTVPNEMSHPLLHFHVCVHCGVSFRREEVEGRVHTTGLFLCPKCGREGPLEYRDS